MLLFNKMKNSKIGFIKEFPNGVNSTTYNNDKSATITPEIQTKTLI